MKSRVVFFAGLACALFAFAAPQGAWAQQKGKLTEAQVEAIFKRVEKSGVSAADIQTALGIIEAASKGKPAKIYGRGNWTYPRFTPSKSAQKSLMDFIDPEGTAVEIGKIKYPKVRYLKVALGLKDFVGLYGDWKTYNDRKTITQASNLTLEFTELLIGYIPGTDFFMAYYKAGFEAVKKALKIINKKNAQLRWLNIQLDEEFSKGTTRKIKTDISSTMPYVGWAFQNEEFTEAWFCTVWEQGLNRGAEQDILADISDYLLALDILKKAGLM